MERLFYNMNNIITVGRGLEITDAMHNQACKALKKLNKYNIFPIDSCARVVVKASPEKKIEITIPTTLSKNNILRAELVYKDFYSGILECVDKLESQIVKNNSYSPSAKKASYVNEKDYLEANEVYRVKNVIPDVISIDEAINEMNLTGHDFYIFTDIDNNTPAVLYKRKAKGYGVIYIK